MNKNKGIIGIGLIIAIVLGIVIVGGGAYYLGKNGSKQAINNPTDYLPNNQDQNLQPVSQNQPVDNSVKAVTLDMSSELARTYTTALNNALKQPANFNGHYVVASWGCGSGCLSYGIVDKLTGKVYQAPGDDYGNTAGYSGDADFNANRWLVSSNVFKAIGRTSIDIYTFNNEKFTKTGSNPFTINSATKTISTANWKTYTNSDYGFSFQYPNTWSLNEPSNSINLKGEIMAYEINFNDTATQSVFSLAYHLAPYGAEVYKLAEEDYISSKNSNERDTKQISISGNNAVETLTTMSKDIKGNIYDPALKLIHIVFLDKQKTGSFNLNFRTPEPGSDKEIAKFNQLLSTFKFTN